jgi:peptidoglycan/xylan/chitin deacetylase (PgdA/CDA1 family)
MIKALVKGVLERVAAAMPPRTKAGDRLILAYHGILPPGVDPCGDASLHLPLARFEQQLRALQREADVVPLMDLLQSPPSRDRLAAITFDDAYFTALDLGVRACDASKLPCTVFVSPDLLGTVPVWDRRAESDQWSAAEREFFLWSDSGRDGSSASSELPAPAPLRIADAAQLREMLAAFPRLKLGNHTQGHPNLGALSNADTAAQVSTADVWLRRFAGDRLVPVLAYPYGIPPRHPEASVPQSAARFAVLASGGWHSTSALNHPLRVPRWNVPAGMSTAGFVARLRGRQLWSG